MSAAQAIASEQFLDAMGPMVKDATMMKRVMTYITLLRRESEPCQFSKDEMHAVLAESLASVRAYKGTTHADLKKEIAQWL